MVRPATHHAPELFRRGISPGARCLVGLAAATALLVTDAQYDWSDSLRSGGERLTAPLYSALATGREQTADALQHLQLQGSLLERIRELEDQNMRLQTGWQSLSSLRQENTRLRELLELPPDGIEPVRFVQLLQRGRSSSAHRLLINAGRSEGISLGMALVEPNGVVGQVVRVGGTTSEVALITDKGQATPVQIARTGQRAVLIGDGIAERASLRFLANNADIEPGDRLVTSGLDSVYPAGMAVATVTSVERDTQSEFAVVRCRPVARLETQRHFAVVRPLVKPDPGSAANRPPPDTP